MNLCSCTAIFLLTQGGDGKVTVWRREGGRRAEDRHLITISRSIELCYYFSSLSNI